MILQVYASDNLLLDDKDILSLVSNRFRKWWTNDITQMPDGFLQESRKKLSL